MSCCPEVPVVGRPRDRRTVHVAYALARAALACDVALEVE